MVQESERVDLIETGEKGFLPNENGLFPCCSFVLVPGT